MTESRSDAQSEATSEADALRLKLEEAEARYANAAHDLNSMRKAMAKAGEASASQELRRLRQELDAIKRSTVWRMTAPARVMLDVLRNPRRASMRFRALYALVWQSAVTEGWPTTLGKIRRKISQRLGMRGAGASGVEPFQLKRTAVEATSRLALRVLLIAETTLPQCFKYRVAQKQKMIELLGYECTVVSWREPHECMQALQTHAVAIFYRTPSFPEVMRMIDEARQLGVPTFWEVDDLIFDADKYATNQNLKDLTTAEMRHLLSDAEVYRKAMAACDGCIASTQVLGTAMTEAGGGPVYVIENALDEESLRIAEVIRRKGKPRDGFVRIVYGSGTRTHDTDFRLISAAVLAVLNGHPDVRFRVIGQLNLPPEFDRFADRIERFPLSDYPTYLGALAECDISIAPLESSVFSDAKSNIKFLEAAVVGLPSVCSPRSAFRQAITHAEDGFLADTIDDWKDALEELVRNEDRRAALGAMALKRAVDGYSYTSIAKTQVLPLLKSFERARSGLRVLAVNVFFEPRSFGGATIVAEEMARMLNTMDGVEYHMFTSLPTSVAEEYQVVRYDAKGAVVFGMGLPAESDKLLDYDNPYALAAFAEALRAVRPHVVHLHSVQGIGASIADVCRSEGIPYAVTLHDAWWICARQFMITPAKRYCYQTTVDLDVCAALCVSRTENEPRQRRLHGVLAEANLLLSPSAFFRDIYIANGFDPARVVVNKNGIRTPQQRIEKTRVGRKRVRFGYVGGDSHIKGAHLIKRFFASTPYTEYDLVVVDNTINLGMRSIDARLWKCTGNLRIKPAYTQDTIDEFFADIDVLLFPTQWKESFGLTVREALIRDVWVVATHAGGVIEEIVDGENGDIIPLEDDGTRLAEVLTGILQQPERVVERVNDYKDQICTLERQARELREQLASIRQ